jgi:hypothetical protein
VHAAVVDEARAERAIRVAGASREISARDVRIEHGERGVTCLELRRIPACVAVPKRGRCPSQVCANTRDLVRTSRPAQSHERHDDDGEAHLSRTHDRRRMGTPDAPTSWQDSRVVGPARVASRIIVTLLFALWWGGFTFYAAVVVPIGGRILGSATAQGFVTQPVSNRLNILGAVVIIALAWNAWSVRRDASPRARRMLAISWAVLAIAQLVLVALHWRLDGMVDLTTRSIASDHATFSATHRSYLLVATVQWLAAITHAVTVGYAWSSVG